MTASTVPLRAIIYARVSSDEQADNNSLPTQIQAMRDYCARTGLTITAEFKEDFTGTKLDRPEFSKILRLVREQRIDAVVAYRADRLTRNPGDGIYIREQIQRRGIELHYATRGKVDLSPQSEMFSGFEDLMSRSYLLTMQEQLQRGRWGKARGNAEKGQPPRIPGAGRVPYGYVKFGDPKTATYEPIAHEADIVRMIFTWYVRERMSVPAIMRRLNAEGVPSPGSRHAKIRRKRDELVWIGSAIYQILRNETYAGVYYCHTETVTYDQDGKRHTVTRPRDEWIAIPVTPIIDRALWEAAQEQLTSGRQQSQRNTKYQHLCARRMRCSCGYTMQVRRMYIGDRAEPLCYYHCTSMTGQSNNIARPACGSRRFRTDTVDAAAWDWIVRLITDPEDALAGYEGQQQLQKERNAAVYDQLADYDTSIERYRGELDSVRERLLDPRWQGDDDQGWLLERKRQTAELLDDLKLRRAVLAQQLTVETITPADIAGLHAFRAELGDELTVNTSYEFRRAVMERLGVSGTLADEADGQVLYIHWKTRTDALSLATVLSSTDRTQDSRILTFRVPLPVPRRAAA